MLVRFLSFKIPYYILRYKTLGLSYIYSEFKDLTVLYIYTYIYMSYSYDILSCARGVLQQWQLLQRFP